MHLLLLCLGLIFSSHTYAVDDLFCNNDDDFFYCGSEGGNKCIPVEWVCDYVPDCPNGKDELQCNYLHLCSKGDFMCIDGQCLSANQKCNGQLDCDDHSDEDHCHSTPRIHNETYAKSAVEKLYMLMPIIDSTINKCGANKYFCGSDGANKCIPESWRCDYVRDCPNSRDEDSCEYPVDCNEDEFLCNNGQCINARYKCDGIVSCTDFSDEFYCDDFLNISDKNPISNGFTANNSSQLEQTDELQELVNALMKSCNKVSEFFCTSDKKCIDGQLRCNGKIDCNAGEDEIGCSICESNEMKTCANGIGCYSHECDGIWQCDDGSDEIDCDYLSENSQFRFRSPKPLSGQCDFLKEYQETLATYLQTTSIFMRKMAIHPPCYQDGSEIEKSILIEGISESYTIRTPSIRRAQDQQALTTYLDRLGTEAYPIAFYRIGNYNPIRMRTIKAIFSTQRQQADVLKKHLIFNKYNPQHKNQIFIKPVV